GTPSGLAALIGASALLLVAYRLFEEPGNDAVTTTKLGAILGLLAIGALTLGSLSALRAEQDGSVWAEPEAASQERSVVQTPVE
nr:hypothetical protein [Thermoleophilaceae bacterium]